MLNAYDQIIWIAADVLALAFLATSVAKGSFLRLAYLRVYIGCMVLADLVRFLCMRAYGFRSTEYYVTYFVADYFVVVFKYLAVMSLFEIVLEDSPLRDIARRGFFLLFALLAVLSSGLIPNSSPNMFSEFQQNIYFAVVVLTAILCVTLAHLRVANPQLRMVVYGFGVSAAMQAIGWALKLLISQDLMALVARRLGQPATVIMLGLWCYALLRLPSVEQVSEEAFGVRQTHEDKPQLVGAMIELEARG
jgi:hypothetical protein